MDFSVIPRPSQFKVCSEDPVFTVSSFMKIRGEEDTILCRDELLVFLRDCLEITPIGGKEEILFIIDKSLTGKPGSYSLKVEKGKITLSANSAEGLFYAVQSLKLLLFQGKDGICALQIEDEPVFDSRGFMLDCSRHFFSKENIFRFLDLMALHKLNEFHWHLSDDQGFRCELECAPLLTLIGSYRSHTGSDTKPHEGYYTKQDIKDIISYAHSKFIRVIPEINSPGHTVSMISAYPELSCLSRETDVATSWGIRHDVLCPGKESTFEFMFRLYDELTELFPDGTVHIGGNDVPTTRWEICPHCQQRMKNEGLKTERELRTYYLGRICAYLQSKGVNVRTWYDRGSSEVIGNGICQQLCEDIDEESIDKAENGTGFILSPSQYCSLDLSYSHMSLIDAYSFNPLQYGQKNAVYGVEACLWTEYVPDTKAADYALLPRLGAFCECAWTENENRDCDRFLGGLDSYYGILYALGFSPAGIKAIAPGKTRRAISLLFEKRKKLSLSGLITILENRNAEGKHHGKK